MQEFIEQDYLIIHSNKVVNIVTWNGDTNIWTPPIDSIALIKSKTPAMVWISDNSVTPAIYNLQEVMGVGEVNFTYDGTFVITNLPDPSINIASENQPLTTGTVLA